MSLAPTSTPILIHLKNGNTLKAKSYDDRSTPTASVFVGMDDETIVVTKAEISALVFHDEDAEKEYFGH